MRMAFHTDLNRGLDLLVALTWRDLRVRYKQSALGAGWAVLLPVSMMLLFTFVFTRTVDVKQAWGLQTPYALFAFSGLVPWTFFGTSLTNCVNSLVANRNLVTKVYFPREVFPLSATAVALMDFLVAMTVLLAFMIYFHLSGRWTLVAGWGWFCLPGVVLIQLALTLGLGMILSMANLFYRDVRPVFGVVLQLWMFVSGVVIPIPRDGSLSARVLMCNPMVPIIEAYRECLLHGRVPHGAGLAYAGAVSLTLLIGGWMGFRRASYRFAECI